MTRFLQRHATRRSARTSARCVVLLFVGMAAISPGGCKHASTPTPNFASLSLARDAARFAVVAATDSTVTFRPVEVRWLRAGLHGHVVDPTQRDALIARVTIQRVDTSGVLATIVGGVAPVALTHVVLFSKPAIAWWRDKRFWVGAGVGVVTGIIATSATQ